jgi:hypothetical protein
MVYDFTLVILPWRSTCSHGLGKAKSCMTLFLYMSHSSFTMKRPSEACDRLLSNPSIEVTLGGCP